MNILFVGIRENELITTSAPKRVGNALYNRLKKDLENNYYFFSLNFEDETHLKENDSRVINGNLKELDKFIKSKKIDVVYFARYYSKVAMKLIWLKIKYKFKLIYTAHGIIKKEYETNNSFGKLSVFIERLLFKLCDKIVVVSDDSKYEILRYYKNLKSDKVEVIPNGVNKINSDPNFDFKEENKIKNHNKNILTVGIRKIKNIELLLHEFVNNDELYKSTNLIVIGEKETEYGKYIVEKYNKYSNVYFLDFIEPKKLFKIYEDVDLYVQISKFETFGMSIVEAILSDTKVIISKTLPIANYFNDNEVYYYDAKVNSLSNTIINSLSDNDNKKIKAYNKAKRLFNWEYVSKQYKALFESFTV